MATPEEAAGENATEYKDDVQDSVAPQEDLPAETLDAVADTTDQPSIEPEHLPTLDPSMDPDAPAEGSTNLPPFASLNVLVRDSPPAAFSEYETSDDTYFQSAATRLLDSPLPSVTDLGLVLAPALEEGGLEDMRLTIQLSRAGSAASLAMAEVDEDKEWIHLRPSSPTLNPGSETQDGSEENKGDEQEGSSGNEAPQESVEEQPPVPVEPEKPKVNREELIAQIKNNLDMRERYKAKNLVLQAKLVEYFKKRRVSHNV